MSGASEKAYVCIRNCLLNSEYPPGSRLSESELSEKCGVSRTPVREALRRLAAEYFVRIEPNRGAFVIDWSREDIMDMFQMRSMMEGFMARKAAERVSESQILNMHHITSQIDELVAENNPELRDKFLTLNRKFHDAIFEASGSPKLKEIISRFVEQAVIVRTAAQYTVSDIAYSNLQHKEILGAMEARNGILAESVMRAHILAAGSRYHDNYMPNKPKSKPASE